jgi:hypothetical protein
MYPDEEMAILKPHVVELLKQAGALPHQGSAIKATEGNWIACPLCFERAAQKARSAGIAFSTYQAARE